MNNTLIARTLVSVSTFIIVNLSLCIVSIEETANAANRASPSSGLLSTSEVTGALEPSSLFYMQRLSGDNIVQGDMYGFNIAVSGKTIVITSNLHGGKVWIYQQHEGELWRLQQILGRPNNNTGEQFGISVAIDGNTIVVGSRISIPGENYEYTGATYVYVQDNNVWSLRQSFYPIDRSVTSNFGNRVAIDGNVIAVTAYSETIDKHKDAGSVYVFEFNSDKWRFNTRLISDELERLSSVYRRGLVGGSVAISGNRIVSRGFMMTDTNQALPGIYVFEKISSTWILRHKLHPDFFDSNFGDSVDIEGNVIVAGAPWSYGTGGVYIFKIYDYFDLISRQYLTSPDPIQSDLFGFSVSLDADRLVVGSPGKYWGYGAALVFSLSNDYPVYQQMLTQNIHRDINGGPMFGETVASSEAAVIIGTYKEGNGTGAAYVYLPRL